MYQTRRQLLKVNAKLQNSVYPEISKINLRKKGKEPACESPSNSAKKCCTQSVDKENLTTAKYRQRQKRKSNKCQVLINKNVDFKSANTMVNSVATNLIYNKCLNGSKINGEENKRSVSDVYDINADDDLKKEELDLKKRKKLKHKVKKENLYKNKKLIKKPTKLATEDKVIIPNFKNSNEIQCQTISSLSKECKDLHIQKVNHTKNFSMSEEVEFLKLGREEFCFEEDDKINDSSKLVLKETTPVKELDFNTKNEDSINSGSEHHLSLTLLTSTPQTKECPRPTFTAPVISFDARLSEVPAIPLLSEVATDIVVSPEKIPSENEPECLTASCDYSLILFGSPQKDEEINKKKALCLADGERKTKNKKREIKQIASNWRKLDPCVLDKTNAEIEEEEAFYKSFNHQLSEIENYELCIE